MGQRTNIILKVTDFKNNTKVTIYHDQWGIGRKPLLNAIALFHSYYNKPFEKSACDTVHLNPEECGITKQCEIFYANGNLVSDEREAYVFNEIKNLGIPSKIGEYIDTMCCNNNGALVIHVNQAKDEIKIGFLLGHEDEYEIFTVGGKRKVKNKSNKKLGKAFERWLSIDEYCGMQINKPYADRKFVKICKDFFKYFVIREFANEEAA